MFPKGSVGHVANVAGSTVTVTNRTGTDTVLVSLSTKYFQKGATPTGVSQGELVSAFGLPDSATPGGIGAQVVAIFRPPPPQPQPQTPAPTTQPPSPDLRLSLSLPVRRPSPTARLTSRDPSQLDVPQSGGPATRGRTGHAQGTPTPTNRSWGGHFGAGVWFRRILEADSADSAGTTSDKSTATIGAPTGAPGQSLRGSARDLVAFGQPGYA